MCGITAVVAFNESGKFYLSRIAAATDVLQRRGPDNGRTLIQENMALGHRRLSILDLSECANQPMFDSTLRYVIVFNGEIFNYRELKNGLVAKGISFRTESDTEVILELYKQHGNSFLNRLNGFFAFILFDTVEKKLLVARDRYGVKPLWIYRDEHAMLFASELKGLLAFGFNKQLDYTTLYQYLQLNYVPGNTSMLKNVSKLEPGCFLTIHQAVVVKECFYEIPFTRNLTSYPSYNDACDQLENLMDRAVERRLISDVPLGSFLSGGIDSSVVTALASRHVDRLNTFSVGYNNDSFYDETRYAELVAKKCNTHHTVFSLTQDDVFQHLDDILDYIDEPFADSSALPVFVLSQLTRKHVTVALSGDGADELFGGYIKHWAEYRMRNQTIAEAAVVAMEPLLNMMPRSRSTKIGNTFRQLNRFASGAKLSAKERYWRWCSITDEYTASKLLSVDFDTNIYNQRKTDMLKRIDGAKDLNDMLYTDMQMVLPGDMLVKVDLMSMANSLEVRTPFLDYTVVDFAFGLPSKYKTDRNGRKKIVQDAFRNILPEELYNRPKKGFEVPLLEWMRTGLSSRVTTLCLDKERINHQGVFNHQALTELWKQVNSNNPEDSAARMWAVLVFQHWWNKYYLA